MVDPNLTLRHCKLAIVMLHMYLKSGKYILV